MRAGFLVMVGDLWAAQVDIGGVLAEELSSAGFDEAEEIGRGGFGVVYRCAQAALDRVVAVKVLTADLNEHRERFVREQQAMGRLTGHPNILAVLQVGETESGYPYLVMPYLKRGCLEDRIRRFGLLPVEEVLQVGVKMAGALEASHRLGVVHRDVKPGNIMLTDYGEPALTDFGIAHITGGFKTAAGVFTGTPAFIAPEVLGGDPPSPASDTYGLGATLFCALTGHAAFERRSGEEVVAQFVRIAADPVPDLRERGIPDDVSAVVERAMHRDPCARPSVLALGEALQQLQANRGLAIDEMAVPGAEPPDRLAARPIAHASARRGGGRLPVPLASFVGRRTEVAELGRLLSTSRLVTLTGVGGVGKTTLAMHAARELSARFRDGVSLVELADLRDRSLLTEVVAAAMGVRTHSAESLIDVLVDCLHSREALLVFDNCEHLIDATAEFVQTLLRSCPSLHILATSREVLGVDGESVLPLAPLPCPDFDSDPTPTALSEYDAVALFVERARAAVPGFVLTERNAAAVSRICARLDGVPLALELAAARVRAMSLSQISDGLSDRYALLNQGRRGAPSRQQTLTRCVEWSYELCTPAEQQLWSRLSVFAGGFDLPAAHDVCGEDVRAEEFLNQLSALVDKSILIRDEHDDAVRFRLLETLREYGKQRIADTADHRLLRRRHADWYRKLIDEAEAEWFGPHQVEWIHRLTRDMPNIREALQFTLTESPEHTLQMLGAMRPIWMTGAMIPEARHWLDLVLAATPAEASKVRIWALCAAAVVAAFQHDVSEARIRLAEMRAHLAEVPDPTALVYLTCADVLTAWMSGELHHGRDCLQDCPPTTDAPEVQAMYMYYMGAALSFVGEFAESASWFDKALAVCESHGETVYQSKALGGFGLACWLQQEHERADELLRRAVQLSRAIDDRHNGAQCLEVLAWVAGATNDTRRAAVLLAASAAVGRAGGFPVISFAEGVTFRDACERRAREALGDAVFDAAWREGSSLSFEQAVDFGVGLTTGEHDTLIEPLLR